MKSIAAPKHLSAEAARLWNRLRDEFGIADAGGPLPWAAVLEPERVPAWWREWRREHPKADHPAGAGWIDWGQT